MPPRLFTNRTSAIVAINTFPNSALRHWSLFFLPVYFQSVELASQRRAGICLIPLALFTIPSAAAGAALTYGITCTPEKAIMRWGGGGGESAKTVQELQSISVLYWGKYTYSVIFQDHSAVLSMKRALSSGFTRNPYVMKSFSKFSSFPPTLARSKVQSSFAMKSLVSLHATSFPSILLGLG